MSEVRTCTGCLEVKPVLEFGLRGAGSDKRRSRCRPCVATYTRERRQTNADFRARQLRCHRLGRYNLTEESLLGLWEAQDFACAICRLPLVLEGASNFAVDHDHACCPPRRSCGDCVRGLLCPPCNQGLGQLGDNVSVLLAAAEYLQRHARVIG